jgi:hypothetical protein
VGLRSDGGFPVSNDWKNFEIGAEVDVTEIMNRIRAAIEEKQKSGIYTEESLAELADAKLLQLAEETEIDSVLLERLMSPDQSWNISPSYIITSHRSGFQASLIVWLKKIVRPFIRLYTDHIIGRQAQLNLYFSHLIHNLVRELTRLQIDHSTLKNRIDRIEREKDILEKRLKTFEKLSNLPDLSKEMDSKSS